MKKGGKTLKNVLVALGSLGVLILLLLYMSGAFHSKIEPGRVEVAHEVAGNQPTDEVHKIVDTETVEVVGTLRAVRRTEVAPKIMAAIEEIAVSAGDRVDKGAVVVRLDDRDARAQLEQANQAVMAAEANLSNARNVFERMKGLYDQKVATQQEFDEGEAKFKVAEAERKRSREAVISAQTLLSYTEIRSPISGIVVDKLANVGDTASPGHPLMAIYDPTSFRLEAAVPEALSSTISIGRKMKVRLDAIDKTVEGEVSEIVPQTEAASRSFLVKVLVPEEAKMVEGMFGRLMVPTRQRTRFCVALSAVRQVGQLRFVEVVGPDGTLERRQVKLGEHSEQGRVEVLSGLRSGERVVLFGPPPPALPENVKELLGGEVQ